MNWSQRVGADLAANRLTRAADARRAEGRPLIDLTLSNPTCAGFAYPPGLLAALGADRALVYRPEPLGLAEAREAVAADYRRRGVAVPAGRIVLTASTSEAYSLLFKVLCDPGAEVLVPRPSYPLLDHLTRLDAVVARPYDLEYHGRWSLDVDTLERAWSPSTRLVVVVSPNNPTGSRITRQELDRVATLAAERQAAIVVDEVFADYELQPAREPLGTPLGDDRALTFSLGGLSKTIGLPQAKLAWIAAAGPGKVVDEALERLAFAADAYLSVATPVQLAAADLLASGAAVREQIRARVAANHAWLTETLSGSPCSVLDAEAGWYAVVRVPAIASEEEIVLGLLSEGVLTHPGYFYDFPREAYLVASLLPPPHAFRDGIARLTRHFACTTGRP